MPQSVTRLLLGLCIAIPLLLTRTARADNLDVKLLDEVPRLLAKLDNKPGKNDNIGVLHFRIQRGKGAESFNTAPLSQSLAFRLENAILVRNPNPQDPYKVLRDSTAVAARHGIRWSSARNQDAAVKKLFAQEYPVAWGKEMVKAHLFLTGLVKLDNELSSASVIIESLTWDDKTGKAHREVVHQFQVKADRSLLADLGETFLVKRGTPLAQRDAVAIKDAHRRNLKRRGDPDPDPVSPTNAFGIQMQILYDGMAQEPVQDSSSPGEWRVPPPKKDQRVTISLNNKDSNRLGAVIQLNGRGLYQEEILEPKVSTMWPMKPGEFREFKGFWTDLTGTNLRRFTVLDEQESKERAAEFGDKVGLLRLDVFESGSGPSDGEVMPISLRGGSRAMLKQMPTKKLPELQSQLISRGHIRFHPPLRRNDPKALIVRGVIVPEVNASESAPLFVEEFKNPIQRGGITIRYYKPEDVEMPDAK